MSLISVNWIAFPGRPEKRSSYDSQTADVWLSRSYHWYLCVLSMWQAQPLLDARAAQQGTRKAEEWLSRWVRLYFRILAGTAGLWFDFRFQSCAMRLNHECWGCKRSSDKIFKFCASLLVLRDASLSANQAGHLLASNRDVCIGAPRWYWLVMLIGWLAALGCGGRQRTFTLH